MTKEKPGAYPVPNELACEEVISYCMKNWVSNDVKGISLGFVHAAGHSP